jgi:gliding motility-associated-like protein
MIRTLTLFVLFGIIAGSATAQTPGNISVTHGSARTSASDAPKLLCNNFAGTVTLGSVIGQSNDGPPGVIYLCFGDTLPVNHNGDFNLSGDPQPATAPGIGYVFYDCMPTVSGTTLQEVQQDLCINRTSPIIINGVPVPQNPASMMWVATDQANGDALFINNGLLQSAYNNGTPAPRQFWFAPITLDNFATRGFENSGGTAGPCVHVNTAAAFSVVYLNAITIANITNNQGAGGCAGSFRVSGGLPEFDPTAAYTYQITLTTDPQVRGTVTSSSGHNGLVEFTVPQAGTYNISVSDGKSCSAFGTVDMSTCTAVTFSLPLTNGAPGTNICLDVRVEDFNNVGAFQFSMQWDPAILQFTNVQGFNPALLGFDQNAFNTTAPLTSTGRLTVSWADLSFMGVSVPDGSSVFQVCFDVIGNLGSFSNVTFTDSPTNIEIGDAGLNSYGFVGRPGIVNVSNSQLFVNLTQDSVSCASVNDGAFTLTVANGTPPYVFNWSSLAPLPLQNGGDAIPVSGGSYTVGNRAAGAYRLVITDSSVPAITVIDTVTVLRGPALGVLMEVTPPTCNGLSNGSVRAVISLDGVVTPNPTGYTFTWNLAGAPNGPQISGLPFGFYAVTVSDPSGCSAMASATMTQPSPLNATATITNAACSGSANGFINVVASGGTSAGGNYNFSWSGGLGTVIASSSTVANLDPGQYCLTITDGNGCTTSDCYTVGAVKTLNINAAVTDITCNGSCNGAILVNGSTAGAPAATPYTFTWSSNLGATPINTATSSSVSGLCAGTYTVTMSDADPTGCRVVRTITLEEPAPIVVSLLQQVNETCTVGNDGRAVPGVSGGTAPYTFAWRNAQQTIVSTDSIASGLAEGSYTLLVTDARACTGTLTVNILAPTPPAIMPIVPDTVSCAGSTDGALSVSASPGSAAITTYTWSNGMNGASISGLSPGAYQVTVTAQDACFSVATGLVVSPSPLVIDSIATVSPSCPGNGNGSIAVFASGGTAPYRYIWASQPQNDTLTFSVYPSRAAGTYVVTVVDANNCNPVTATAIVTDPPAIQIDFSAVQAVSCAEGACNGQATAMARYSNGASGTFLFNWESGTLATGVSTSSVTNLCAGFQTLVVTDPANCFTVDSVFIPSPPVINIFVDAQPVSCNGGNDGRVTLNVSGGTPGYQYLWIETGATLPTIGNLSAGQYNAVVTDANGCVKAQRVEISQPDELILTVDGATSTASVTCSGSTDGVIRVFYNSADNINPIGPSPYTWSGNIAPASSPVATNLSPGTYSVTITDTKGCRDSLTYTISSPPPIVAIIPQPEDPLCFGEATVIVIDTIYGGNGTDLIDYTYEVDNNGLSFLPDQPATVFAGPHTITIEDLAGCRLDIQITVNQPQELQVIFDPAEIVVELGDTTVRLNPLITSSLPIATYAWTPTNTLSDPAVQRPRLLQAINDQAYELVVTDINGCMASGSVRVEIDKNRNVYIPNAFSPNGDGPNDEFRIFACLGVANINAVRIFDRWGGMVFEQTDVQPDCIGGTRLWDGSLGGKPATQGVYIYMVEVTFVDGITLLYRGDVTILR